MINEKDLIINTVTTIGSCVNINMTVIHKPSGIKVFGTDTRNHRLEVKLIKELELKLENKNVH